MRKLKTNDMILIVGLGNPGKQYEDTPHNAGFRVLDFLARLYLPRGEWEREYESELLKGEIDGKRIVFQKPFVYMNNSGMAVKHTIRKYGIDYTNCWVAHDDLDLSCGRVKIEEARNSAGHKGVESIINALGTNKFWRFRIGIKPEYFLEKKDIDAYLTQKSISQPWRALEVIIHKEIANRILQYIKGGIVKGDFYTAND